MLHVHVDGELAFPGSFKVAAPVVAAKDAGRVDTDPVGVLLMNFQQDAVLKLFAANAAESGFGFFVMNVFHVI